MNIRYYGIEYEVDGGKRSEKLYRQLGKIMGDVKSPLFYMKRDGSLSDNGIEIVTHPCSVMFHSLSFPWESMVKILKEHGYKTDCGLEAGIHIATPVVKNSDRYATFVNIAADNLWSKIAGRRSTYARFISPSSNSFKDFITAVRNGEKYTSTNFKEHNGVGIVETRIFKTFIDADIVRAYIEAVHHAHMFTENLSCFEFHKYWKDKNWWFKSWFEYINSVSRHDCKYIRKYLKTIFPKQEIK